MGITVDTSAVDKMLDAQIDALSAPGMRELGKVAERALDRSTNQAFMTASNPETGGAWAQRKGNPSWRPLDKTGKLKGSLYTDLEVGRTGFYLSLNVRDSRSGNRSYHAIAGVHFFGRKDQRSKIIGRGNSIGKGGPMPARRFAGFSRNESRKLREAAQKAIRRT